MEIDFQDFSKDFWVYIFFQNFPCLEIAVLKFHDFSRFFMTIQNLNVTIGAGRVRLSKSDFVLRVKKKKYTWTLSLFRCYHRGLMRDIITFIKCII